VVKRRIAAGLQDIHEKKNMGLNLEFKKAEFQKKAKINTQLLVRYLSNRNSVGAAMGGGWSIGVAVKKKSRKDRFCNQD